MADPLQAVAPWARAMWQRDAASRALGMELLAAGGGRCQIRMRVRDDMLQGHGSCHGGIIFALGDSAFAFCCNGPGTVVVGASADVTWVGPAVAGDVLVADGQQEVVFGRSGVTLVRITRERDGALVALFQGRSRQVPARGS